jgi:hypothetical protein
MCHLNAHNLEYIQYEIDNARLILHAAKKQTGASVQALAREKTCGWQRGKRAGDSGANVSSVRVQQDCRTGNG